MILTIINCIIWLFVFLININLDEIDKHSYSLMFIALLLYIMKDIIYYIGV